MRADISPSRTLTCNVSMLQKESRRGIQQGPGCARQPLASSRTEASVYWRGLASSGQLVFLA
eukprot:scaffold97001_cov19-Tisochrysis_lutea.AAC.1